MAEFTFLKLQVEDATITANAPFSGNSGTDEDAGPASDGGDEGDEESTSLVPFLVGFVFLVVLVVVVRKLRSGSEEVEVDGDQ